MKPFSNPTSKIELTLSCNQLLNLDVFSKSDPQVIIFAKKYESAGVFSDWKEIGRTEIIRDNLDPKFVKSFNLDYFFQLRQPLKFLVIDIDKKESTNFKDHDYIGEAETSLSELVASNKPVTKELYEGSFASFFPPKKIPPGHKRGSITIRVEEIDTSNTDVVYFKISGRKMDKKDFFGTSDPVFELCKFQEDGKFQPVYRSEVHKNTVNVTFNSFSIPLSKLCGGDKQRPLLLNMWDWNSSGKYKTIGAVPFTIETLEKKLEANNGNFPIEFEIIHEKKQKRYLAQKKQYKNSGILQINEFRIEKNPTFMQYVHNGFGISVMVAIDFTASNRPPNDRASLHYFDKTLQQRPESQGKIFLQNDYLKAIYSICSILQEYDSDKLIPTFGFGAKIMQNGTMGTSHCFPLNLNFNAPECKGVNGILQSYNDLLSSYPQKISFSGPTIFGPVIETVTKYANKIKKMKDNNYVILLILTDGLIDQTNMQDIIDRVVDLSYQPASIIIVGLGDTDFTAMEILDADEKPLYHSSGKKMARDIVQFVAFEKYKQELYNFNPSSAAADVTAALTAELLEEIPRQFLDYMKAEKIPPPAPLPFQQPSFPPQPSAFPQPTTMNTSTIPANFPPPQQFPQYPGPSQPFPPQFPQYPPNYNNLPAPGYDPQYQNMNEEQFAPAPSAPTFPGPSGMYQQAPAFDPVAAWQKVGATSLFAVKVSSLAAAPQPQPQQFSQYGPFPQQPFQQFPQYPPNYGQ